MWWSSGPEDVESLSYNLRVSVFDLYSKRQKRLRGEFPDVYQYDNLPMPLRRQVIHILTDLFGEPTRTFSTTQKWFEFIHDTLCREYGVFNLVEVRHRRDRRADVFDFLEGTSSTDYALDVIELAIKTATVAHLRDRDFVAHSQPSMTPKDAIEELNTRFREHGVGFQYESTGIVRVDSQYLHQEAVKPALHLLHDKEYEAANDEFLEAHEHYRQGNHSEAVNEALKALESTLKVICHTREWPYDQKDTAKRLLDTVFQNGLIPEHLQSTFGGLRAILENAVPTTRNRMSGHGAGVKPIEIPSHLASYVLHVTAASIVMLVEAEKQLEKGEPG